MLSYLILCRSLTYAQRAASTLERAGVTATVARTPAELAEGGCGYSVRVSERRFAFALEVLRAKNVPFGRAYLVAADGSYREAAL